MMSHENQVDSAEIDELEALKGLAVAADSDEQPDLPPTPEQLAEIEQAEREQAHSVPSSELVKIAMKPMFTLVAPNWKIQDDEINALGDAYGQLLDKYFPDGIGNRWGAEITALLCTATVFGSRVGTPRRLPEKSTGGDDAES